jgi:thioredoxin-related protein
MIKYLCFFLLAGWLAPEGPQAGSVPPPVQWHVSMEEARQLALQQHKHILLNFSGSDWCGPCIMLRKEVFDDPSFQSFADSTLVLVNADFPRLRKNQLPREQQQSNDKLADRYNSQGKFPLTLLLSADGKILKQWEGLPGLKPEAFAGQIEAVLDADRSH